MKRSFGVGLSLAVVLAFGIYLTHRAGDPPASTTMHARVNQLALEVEAPVLRASSGEETEAPVLRASSDEEAGASSTVGDSGKTVETHHEDMAALRQEIARLRAEVSTVQRWIHAQRRAARSVVSERADDPAKDLRTDPAARAAAERERQKQMEVIEANFRQEPADPWWSFGAEGAVQEALASDEIVQHTLLGLECRSHTCRVELADDNTGELSKAMPLFLHQLATTLPSGTAHYVDDGNGGKTMILYMSRVANESPHHSK